MNRRIPDPGQPFARTNVQTIEHRIRLLRRADPPIRSIGELCCGDCRNQRNAYQKAGISTYRTLDIDPRIVAFNRSNGVDCIEGDVMNTAVLRPFLTLDALFFGPPLSEDCDRHRLVNFQDVVPSFASFLKLAYDTLDYRGWVICIGPRDTNSGDIQWLRTQLKGLKKQHGLRWIHHTYSTITGRGEPTEPRLKYVELWFHPSEQDWWERISNGDLPSA